MIREECIQAPQRVMAQGEKMGLKELVAEILEREKDIDAYAIELATIFIGPRLQEGSVAKEEQPTSLYDLLDSVRRKQIETKITMDSIFRAL